MNSKIILGIDPGTVIMGYAVVQVDTTGISVACMDVLKLGTVRNVYERLEMIHSKVGTLISVYQPHTFAIEAPFFGKNVQSMLKLGRAQGVAIAAAIQSGISVAEYSPKKIKQSITGNGNAAKEQVWKMLSHILHFDEKPKYFDATDALAVAMCHHYQSSTAVIKDQSNFKGWQDFVAKNGHRIRD